MLMINKRWRVVCFNFANDGPVYELNNDQHFVVLAVETSGSEWLRQKPIVAI